MAPFVFTCLGKAGTKPFRVEGREKEVKRKARIRRNKKREPPGKPGRLLKNAKV
jgi:hypothetical protein